jgi:hypothetical protein
MVINSYSWEGGVDKMKNKNLPDDKQFLVSILIN